MAESKGDFKSRLMRDDLWKDAVERREFLKAQGVTAEDAWMRVREEFSAESIAARGGKGPEEMAGVVADEPGAQGGAVRQASVSAALAKKQRKSRLVDDITWVYQHLELRDLEPDEAPSTGAWGMLKWAQSSVSSKTEFFRNLLVKILPTTKQLEAEARFSDDGRVILSVIERLEMAGVEPLPLLPESSEGVYIEPAVAEAGAPVGRPESFGG